MLKNRFISNYLLLIAVSSAVKVSNIVFLVWNFVRSFELYYKNNFYRSLRIMQSGSENFARSRNQSDCLQDLLNSARSRDQKKDWVILFPKSVCILQFIKSILKALVILAMWLVLSGAIYSRIVLSFALSIGSYAFALSLSTESVSHHRLPKNICHKLWLNPTVNGIP